MRCGVLLNFFPASGVLPLLDRLFAADECDSREPRVAVVSHRLWRKGGKGRPSWIGHRWTLVAFRSPSLVLCQWHSDCPQ